MAHGAPEENTHPTLADADTFSEMTLTTAIALNQLCAECAPSADDLKLSLIRWRVRLLLLKLLLRLPLLVALVAYLEGRDADMEKLTERLHEAE